MYIEKNQSLFINRVVYLKRSFLIDVVICLIPFVTIVLSLVYKGMV